MLRRSHFILRPSLLATAMNVLDNNNNNTNNHHTNTNTKQQYGVAVTPQAKAPWIDRDEERAAALTEHRHSEVYRELHRRPSKNTELGLYGGEPGFERTPRVWVDPDNPHIKHLWNTAPLSINTRWARYGHFKRELHILDIDKLCRHGRAVPGAEKLLTDLTTARVALDDDGCSALIRHGARALNHLVEDCRGESRAQQQFEALQGVFERFLVAVSPPMYAGVRTHSDMIRCCSLMKDRWEEGFNQYRQRAVDEAADAKLRREQMLGRSRRQQQTRKLLKTESSEPELLEVGNQFSRDALLHDPAFSPFGNGNLVEFNKNKNDGGVNENDGDYDDDGTEKSIILQEGATGSPSDQVAYRSHNAHLFELDSEFYDAVIELCIVNEKYEECVKQLYELIESQHRPRIASLTNGLVAATYLKDAALGDEIPKLVHLYQLVPTVQYFEALAAYSAMVRPSQSWGVFLEAMSTQIRDAGNILKSGVAGSRSAAEVCRGASYTDVNLVARGDAGSHGDHNPFGNSNGTGLMDRDASYDPGRFDNRHRVVMPTGRTVSWSLLGLANNDNCTSMGEALKLLDTASAKGIALDYEQFTFALYFACQKSTLGLAPGEEIFGFVREIVSERLFHMKVNMTPEMILMAVRALARIPTTTSSSTSQQQQHEQTKSLLTACTSLALEIVSSAVDTTSANNNTSVASSLSNHRSSSHFTSIFYELYQLLGRAGAMATFSSTMRNYVLSRGEPVHSWLLRSWLWCNSNAEKPNGSHLTTAEAVEFLMMNRTQTDDNVTSALTKELVMSLVLCRMKHGEYSNNSNLVRSLQSIVLDVGDEDDEEKEKTDDDITLFDTIEYFADLFSNIGKQENSNNTKNQANKKKTKKSMSSLEESLELLLGEESENNNNNDIKNDIELEIESSRKFLGMLLPQSLTSGPSSNTSSSSTEYDVCSLLAQGILNFADASQKKISSSNADNDNDRDASAMLVGYAQILAGLPSEKESSDYVRKVAAEFHPTPSTLRELRARWTIDVYDTALRRQGQQPLRPPKIRNILPHAMQVQPFHDNLRH